jgi:hypothetical protein
MSESRAHDELTNDSTFRDKSTKNTTHPAIPEVNGFSDID